MNLKTSNIYTAPKGFSPQLIDTISKFKNEPAWVNDFRKRSLEVFFKKPLPSFGPDLSKINFDDLSYYVKPSPGEVKKWQDVDPNIGRIFEGLGIPKFEQEYLSGLKTQLESDIIYGSIQKELLDKGVIFCSMEEAVKKHSDLVKKYLGTVVPIADNKFSALNSAFFSGGSFVYVPNNIVVDKPLQTYFRINTVNTGQFERTLIIAEPGSKVHYIEGCTAPNFSSANLHAAVVEIVAHENSQVRYTTIQNWSRNVYNLVTKRAQVRRNASLTWTDANIGSGITMKYPASYLLEEGATASLLSLAIADKGQQIDSGGKMLHLAPNTHSNILSKSVSLNGGRASFRGLVNIDQQASKSSSKINCQALLIDNLSQTDTYPKLVNASFNSSLEHEAYVSRLSAEQMFYLMSRGLSEPEASSMLVLGFLEPILKDIPLEYSVELNRLMELVMADYYEK